MRRLALLAAGLAVSAGMFLSGGHSVVKAYGTEHLFQLTYSANCDNPSVPLCAAPPAGFGLGGAWGWIEPDGPAGATSGGADGQVTFCSHQTAGLRNGAFHLSLSDTPWIELLGSQLPPGTFPVDFPGNPAETYIDVPAVGLAFPVTPGHYSVKVAPGVQVQATVVQMH